MMLGRGFTLIELMVGVAITMLIGGGALVYINNFNSQNKVEESRSQIDSALRMARSYAVTMQKPVNYSEALSYVGVFFYDDHLEIRANRDMAPSALYLSQKYYVEEVEVSLTNNEVFFTTYSGNLATYNQTTQKFIPSNANEKLEILIGLGDESGASTKIFVDHMGLLVKPTPTLSLVPYPIFEGKIIGKRLLNLTV